MLSREENELLVRVTGKAQMGQMMRRYWVPACLSQEVIEPDGMPIRVKLFGERLVVFRDTAGSVGVLEERCPHRMASLALGRNEEGGLRCIYHGWKFDVHGSCMEMPTEPDDYGYRDRMKVASYPVRESGGLVWTYMGPPELGPPFPEYDWMKLPPELRVVFKVGERTNYLQAVEGAIDSAHSWFLHQGIIWDWKKRQSLSTDTSPKLETEDTIYGMRYAAVRKTTVEPDKQKYVRVTLFPGADNKRFAFTIVDDTDTMLGDFDEQALDRLRPIYDPLLECGLKTTKTVWVLAGEKPPAIVTISTTSLSRFLSEPCYVWDPDE